MRLLQILIAAVVIALVAIVAIALLHDEGGNGNALPAVKPGGTPLEAGHYRTTTFDPQTTFEVEKGWATTSPELPDYFDIARQQAFKAISFERVRKVAAAQDPSGHSEGAAPPNLVQWIRAHPRLRAGKPAKTKVDDFPATRVDATVDSATTKLPACSKPCLPLFIPSDGRPVSYEPGDRLRFLFVKVGGRQVTVTIAAHAKSFDSFLPQANRVISTVRFATR